MNTGELPALGEKYSFEMKCKFNTQKVKYVISFHEFQNFLAFR